MTTTAEEALERAKVVAARLRGELPGVVGVLHHPPPPSTAAATTTAAVATATTTTTTTSSSDAATATTAKSKRRRWGLAPTAEEQQSSAAVDSTTTTTTTGTFSESSNSKRLRPDLSFLTTAATTAAAAAAPTTPTTTFKRLWISTTKERPAAHFVQYLSDKLPTLVEQILSALPDDANITAATKMKKRVDDDDDDDEKEESNKDDNVVVKGFSMQLEGRGSDSKNAPPPGMPLEPLHIYLTGTTLQIQMAEPLVDMMLQDAEEAPVDEAIRIQQQLQNRQNDLIDAQLEEDKESSRALVALSSSTTLVDPISVRRANTNVTYRPASVAQMIGQIGQGGGGGGGGDTDGHYGSGGGGDTAGGADWMQEEVQVPTSVIGFIIGRGGENISRMQIRTGAKIQIQQNNPSELQPGQTHRTISLSGKADAIAQVKEWIDKVVLEKSGGGGSGGAGTGGGAGSTNQRAPGGPGIGFSSGGNSAEDKNYARIQEAIAAGHVHLQVQVPDVDVGLVIGRQGATIKSLQERTGANIQVPPAGSAGTAEANPGMRIVNITHPSAEGAQAAKALIENMLAERQQQKATAAGAASLDTSSHMAAAAGQPVAAITAPAATSVQILIPDKDVGLCIGRQGCVIRHMQATSQTRIQIPQHCTPAPNDPYNQQPPTRVATIIGSPEGCAMVQQMIGRIIAEQSSAGVMGHSTQQQHGGGGGWQQHHQSSYTQQAQQQLQPSQGQQGYSAEWAAYHAAQQQAATQQQQQQQQQEQAAAVAQQQSIATAATAPTATATTATATGQPAADAYYEEFFRYAYYYGEPAARKHYGAWAPPEGTPNPYGVNPNGVQPAPAAASTTTAAATVSPTAPAAAVSAATVPQTLAAASVPVSDARETSRRKVSNLPAWMTKS